MIGDDVYHIIYNNESYYQVPATLSEWDLEREVGDLDGARENGREREREAEGR